MQSRSPALGINTIRNNRQTFSGDTEALQDLRGGKEVLFGEAVDVRVVSCSG